MPPITQEGKGTIGFMLGNEVWVQGDYVSPSTPTPAGNYLPDIGQLNITCYRMSAYSSQKIDMMGLHFNQLNLKIGEYEINHLNTILSFAYTQKDGLDRSFNSYVKGKLAISRIDLTNKIVAGTFSFDATDSATGEIVKITQGRFDMKWK